MTANGLLLTKNSVPLTPGTWAPLPTYIAGSDWVVSRDPAITTDDSANSVGTQIYDHGAPICERLVGYLQDTQESAVAWPLPTTIQVTLRPGPLGTGDGQGMFGRAFTPATTQAVTFTSAAVSDGNKTTWTAVPGALAYMLSYQDDRLDVTLPAGTTSYTVDSSEAPYAVTASMPATPLPVATGTLRQLISGDEGSTRKVAAILDLLKATTAAQHTTIANTLTANSAAFWAAVGNLATAAGRYDGVATLTPAQRRFWQRAPLNGWLAAQAVGIGFTGSGLSGTLDSAVRWGLMSITAQEAGLVGSTFTTANYTTITDPIDAVLAMPSGY